MDNQDLGIYFSWEKKQNNFFPKQDLQYRMQTFP